MARRKLTTLLVYLLWGTTLCLPTAKLPVCEVDGGENLDIFEINQAAGLDLVEGDILLDERQGRNSIIGDEYRWPKTIPYVLEDNLEVNAKGVILKAFEQYRLKSCIDFKPWSGEDNYISVFKGSGCYSYVGNRHVGKQVLSIGAGCDRIATIEHEFLHALGFWHEQSRSDRDDYVQIMWDRIRDGYEHNFNTYDDTTSSSLGVPYDYNSMMHYSKTAFQNGTEPTIVTKIPAFLDVIGQRMEFSDSDLLKLNRLYKCTQGSTFLDSCDFESENTCGMIQGPGDQADWARVSEAAGGPSTDYSYLGKCTGSGYFMHFSTGTANTGQTALLESRLLYPKRGYQCLQFYYYNSASPSDTLKIYIREYDKANPNGTLRFIQTIDGSPQELWQLHHVSLDAKKKFRVVFEGTKVGSGSSAGGLSLDDINLSETTCPEFVWQVKDFSQLMENTPNNKAIYSPPFTSKEGYTFQMSLYPSGRSGYPDQLSAYASLVAREGDTGQVWPCPWKQITMMLMDQNPHIQKRMSNQRSVTTDPKQKISGSDSFFWDDPRKVGSRVTDTYGSTYYRGPGYGTAVYLSHLRARSRDFIKGGDAIFLLTMEDVSDLLQTEPSIKPTTPEPESTTPELPKPESTTPELPKPESTTPELPKPASTTPDLPKPESTTPDLPKPASTTPELPKPASTTPDLPKPESTTPELPKPASTTPELPKPASTTPDLPKPESTTPELPKPESTTPLLPRPESTTRELPKPESTTPELPKPESTTPVSDVCSKVECLNDGVCVEDNGEASCRCVVGDDWWYYGDRCQYKDTTENTIIIAVASSLSVLAVMLVITIVSVICVKNKYTMRIK